MPKDYVARTSTARDAALGPDDGVTLTAEELDPPALLRERIMLGLRLAEGFDLEGSAEELGVPALPPERRRALDKLERSGRITRLENGRLCIPKSKWLFADGIISELL